MEARNITQFGSLFAAYGCVLNFNSAKNRLEIVSIPDRPNAKDIIDAVLADIYHYDNTSNYQDGMAAIALADYVDGSANDLSQRQRDQILRSSGIIDDAGKFVYQVLALQKTNRAWHSSNEPFKCTHFNGHCTHRGMTDQNHKRGRKSTRKPDQYHKLSATGIIQREQLVTPALENLFRAIPQERLASWNK